VVFVQDIEPRADDGRVMALATAQDRLLVTVDKDFGELALRQLLSVPGVLLVRIVPEQRHQIGQRLAKVLAQLADRLIGHHTVTQEAKVRVRPLLKRNA
jgi:predicted nuclease of predicted toxin-antitoxin system